MKILRHYLLFILVLLLSSCQRQQDNMPKDDVTPMQLNLNFVSDIPTTDPRRASDPISCSSVFLLYEGLTRFSPQSSSQLAIASSVEISDDLLTYIFTLKETYWSNGDKVTAYDFEKSWKQTLDPQFPAPNAPLFFPIKNARDAKRGLVSIDQVGIRAQNSNTLIVHLEHPTPYFLELTSFCPFFPTYQSQSVEESTPQNIISNGPFYIDDWRIRDRVKLKKNTYYHQKNEIEIDQINISFVPDDITALEMYQQGSIDVLGAYCSAIPREVFSKFKQNGELKSHPIAATSFISFNLSAFPFNHPLIRKAIHYAIDRQALIDNITGIDDKIATSLIPPIMREDSLPHKDPYDPQMSKEYFKKGLKQLKINSLDLPPIRLLTVNDTVERKIAQVIQDQLVRHLGLQVMIEEVDFSLFLEKTFSRNYQIALCKMIAQYNDPMDLLSRLQWKNNTKNYPGWENVRYKEILNRAKWERVLEKRNELYNRAIAIMNEEMPISPIYHFNLPYAIHSNKTNLFISPVGSVHFARIREVSSHE